MSAWTVPPDRVGRSGALKTEFRTASPERRAEIIRELEQFEPSRAVPPRGERS